VCFDGPPHAVCITAALQDSPAVPVGGSTDTQPPGWVSAQQHHYTHHAATMHALAPMDSVFMQQKTELPGARTHRNPMTKPNDETQ
jgi:hypothetical protein